MYEVNSSRLAGVLRLHVTAPGGDPLVEIKLVDGLTTADVLPALTRAGFRVQAISELDPSLLEGYAPLSAVRGVAAVTGVKVVRAVQRPHANAGSVQSQAVAVEKADRAQARGIDGRGTRVGILSDSFNSVIALHPNADDDVASGDVPPDVTVLDDLPANSGSGDEGRAMAQLVHDIAPGAQIGFATADKGMISFSNNILNLRRVFHADIITDDVRYLNEPMYSDGLLARTVDQVVSEGAAYFSSAGNSGLEAYEGLYSRVPFDRAQELVAAGTENLDLSTVAALNTIGPMDGFHNFRKADGTMSISQKFTTYLDDVISFQWDEPFDLGKVNTDYDMLVFDANGHFIDPYDPSSPVFYTANYNPASDEPFEFLAFSPGTYQIAIVKWNDSPARRLKFVSLGGLGESDRQGAPSIFGHAAARHGQAVAAVFYGNTSFPEDYSSPGPVTIVLDEAGERLARPEIRRVPQIAGVDGVDMTLWWGYDVEGNGKLNFFGTSAAAPNVAAVAALVVQSAGGSGRLSPDQIYDRLQRTATPIAVADTRSLAFAAAGGVIAVAKGDFSRQPDFWTIAVAEVSRRTIRTIGIDVSGTDAVFVSPAIVPFQLGSVHRLRGSDVSAAVSSDLMHLTLTFAPGSFGAADVISFSQVFQSKSVPCDCVEADADRLRGARLTVTWSDGSKTDGAFQTDQLRGVNNFTGAGLVNADAATRARFDNEE
jgi:hypothetical protein